MQAALSSLHERLAPAEEIFFTWLARVFAGATLVGSAWLDDAPPLEVGAALITIYSVPSSPPRPSRTPS